MIRQLWSKMVQWGWDYRKDCAEVIKMPSTIASSRSVNGDGMRFTVYSAAGGMILEFNRYDSRADRHSNKLYVIPDDEKDPTHRVAQIVMMETMKF
jgi:hypothetical protein